MSRRRTGGRNKPSKPDEHFTAGPLEVARFGKMVVAQSRLTEDGVAAIQQKAVAQYPRVVQEINELVARLVSLVCTLPPEKIMQRAWWESAMAHMAVESEASLDRDQIRAMRMVDYVQSIIASAPPSATRRDDITEEEWESIQKIVAEIFDKVNVEYQICRTAKSRAENPSLDMALEEFRFKAESYWCNVRGKRYHLHEHQALIDVVEPHSAVIKELFGVTAEGLVGELTKILRSLTLGIGEATAAFHAFRRDTLDAIDASAEEDVAGTVDSMMAKAMEDESLRARGVDVMGKLFGMDLFDIEKITNLPKTLLEELSWSEGQDAEFLVEGEQRGWPLRIWPVFKRPFVKLAGRYCCFDVSSLFDNFYRVMQRTIFRLKPDYKGEWNRIQKEVSERLPFTYLKKLLPGARCCEAVYYRWQVGGGARQWCEVDGLLVYGDHLFVIEVKAGAFTYTSPATDLPAHIKSLEGLVLSPATQGRRFVEYLESADQVAIFDKDHHEIGVLRRRDFRNVTICAVTLDAFTELASQAQHLRQIGIDVGNRPLWVLSVDDLRVYADIFDDPLVFLHFVEQRVLAGASPLVELNDELDHLGLYLEHNNYSQYAAELKEGSAPGELSFIGYRTHIDAYFAAKFMGEEPSHPLRQQMPDRLAEVLIFLSKSSIQGRTELAGFLLDMAGDTRKVVFGSVQEQLKVDFKQGRAKPLSTHGGVRLTVWCLNAGGARNESAAVEHVRTIVVANSEPDRVLLELVYSDGGVLRDLYWQRVSLAGLSEHELMKLQANATAFRKARVANEKKLRGKIGRNDPCPCGSGEKFKKCCI